MAVAIAGQRARVTGVRRLTGGVDASTDAVRIEPGGWFVLKRTPSASPRSLRDELERLRFVQRIEVATPVPIAFDTGGWFGHPALVMSRLAGRSTASPTARHWMQDLAEVLAAIHSCPLPSCVPLELRAPNAAATWRSSDISSLRSSDRTRRLGQAASELRSDLADGHRRRGVLLHHDFHQRNVMWQRGRLVGVIDWNEARIGPRESDVAYCSVDIAMTHGASAARRFTDAYRISSGHDLDDLSRWQALWTANAMRWIPHWLSGMHEAGASDLTMPVLRRRLRSFADRVVSRL